MMTILQITIYLLLIAFIVFLYVKTIQKLLSKHQNSHYKLKKKGDLLYAEVRFRKNKYLFLIDTGSEVSMISKKLATKLPCPKHRIEHQEALAIQGISNEIFLPVDTYCTPSINLNNWFITKNDVFYVTELPIDGVIGMSWLRKYKADIVIKTSRLRIPKKVIKEYDIRCNKSTRTV